MIKNKFWRELDKICDFSRDVILKDKTTFKIGGVAPAFLTPKNSEGFCNVLDLCNQNRVKYEILGAGSNVLVRDEEIEYVVVSSLNLTNCYRNKLGVIYAEAGLKLSKLIQFATQNGLCGLEYLIGVPGSVGGAITMNAGAFGVEIGNYVEFVDVWDGSKITRLGRDKLLFEYRHSVFTNSKKYAIIGVGFEFKTDSSDRILARTRYAIQARADTQKVGYASAGSVFRKTSALAPAYMIQACGLKGKRIGDAQVSTVHSGYIVNLGSATCQDVIKLIELVCKTVETNFGVQLELEIILL